MVQRLEVSSSLRANHAAARWPVLPAKSLRVQVDVYETLILAVAGVPRNRVGRIVYQIRAYCVHIACNRHDAGAHIAAATDAHRVRAVESVRRVSRAHREIQPKNAA
jgi:hypothetical protein